MALADTANLAVKLTLDDRGFTGPLNKIQRNLGGLNKGFGRVGKGVGQLGAGFARVGAIAAGAAAVGLAAVAREGIKWESALAGVNKTMDLTPTELQTIGTEIRKLATTIPIGADAIAGLAEQAGALGIAKEDVVEFARVAATLGVTTNVSADEAASALGGLSTILGLTGDEFERFASALVDLGNKGASSEDQILAIAERIAGAGATIGLGTEEILGFSAAAANLKIPAEAAGSSLQKLFLDTLKAVNKSGGELDTFAKTAGTTAEEFAKLFKDDPAAALESFVDGLAGLSKGKRLDVLGDLGFNDIRITRLLLGLAEAEDQNDNLTKSLEYSSAAWAANTAAAAEADKRYKTVGSKLELLKNQAIESALLIGEGFLPALGRMSDKLKAILTDDDQRQTFIDFGKDIGAIIDGIDFNKVLGAAKTFVGVVKSIWTVLRLIPIEISAAVAGFTLLNKASGGLIGAGVGNIVGGLTESIGRSLFTKIPGIGKLGALPVYVVNMGPGGMLGGAGKPGIFGRAAGGLGGALGGGAAVGAAAILASGAALVAGLVATQKLINEPGQQREAGENISDVEAVIASGDSAKIQAALNGVQAGVASLSGLDRILYDFNANGIRVHTESLVAALTRALAVEKVNTAQEKTAREDTPQDQILRQIARNTKDNPDQITRKQRNSFERLRARVEANRIATQTGSNKTATKLDGAKTAVNTARTAIKAGAQNDANRIIAAVRAARPIVSVVVNAATNYTTTVKTGTTSTKRQADINKANRATEGM